MKSPEDSKILPWLFANLQRTLEPNFTYSTLERVRRLCFDLTGRFSFFGLIFQARLRFYCLEFTLS